MGETTLNSLWMPEILQSCPLGILQFDANGRICWANNRMSSYTGLSVARLIGMDGVDAQELKLDVLFHDSGLVEIQPQGRSNAFKLQCKVEELSVPNGRVRVAYFIDVTTQHQLEDKVESLILIDNLTGTLNKRGLIRELDTLVSRSRRYRNPLSIVRIDFDLSQIEDKDTFMLNAAQQLRGQVRWSDNMGRFLECSFLLILPETDEISAKILAQKQLINLQFLCADNSVNYFCAMARWQPGNDVATLLERVNSAMLEAQGQVSKTVIAVA